MLKSLLKECHFVLRALVFTCILCTFFFEANAQIKPSASDIIGDSIAANRFGNQVERLALNAIERTKNKESIAKLYYQLGAIYDSRGDFTNTIATLKKGLKICTNDSLRANYYMFLTRTYSKGGDIDSAIYFIDQGIDFMEKYQNPATEIEMHMVKGSSYFNAIKEDLAFREYDTAIQLMTLFNDSSKYVPIMSNAAACLVRLREYEIAKTYYKKLIAKYSDQTNFIGQVYANIAVVYFNQDSSKQAEYYFLKAIPLLKTPDQLIFLGTVYFNMVQIESRKKAFDKALEYAQLAEPIFKQTQPNRLGFLFSGYADVYTAMGQKEKALEYNLKAFEYAETYSEWEEAYLVAKNLSAYYEEIKDFEHALAYSKKFAAYRDLFLEENKLEAIEKYRISFETNQKEYQIAQLEELNQAKNERLDAQEKIQDLIIGIAIGLLLIGVFITFLVMRFRLHRIQLNNKAQLAELNTKLVLNRLSPHFIFNVLNSIQYYINTNDRKNANTYLTMFADLLRKFLESFSNEYHTLADEVALINEYVSLESMLKNNLFTFQLDVASDVNMDISFPTMLLQPLVENAIKHGTTNENATVKLSIFTEDKNLFCVLEDNGSGLQDYKNEHRSRGMELCYKRIDLLNNYMKRKYALSWTNKKSPESGLKITLQLPD